MRQFVKPFRLLRRDFVEGDDCAFCTRGLTSGVAYIFRDALGQEGAAGPDCGPTHIDPWPSHYVDLARATLQAGHRRGGGRGQGGAQGGADPETRRVKATEYVIMRAVGLVECAWAQYAKLFDPMLARRDETGLLSTKDAEEILSMITRVKPIHSVRHIRACYAVRRLLRRLSRKVPERTGFFESLDAYLVKKGFLTQGQLGGVNEYLVPRGMAPVNVETFAEVEALQREWRGPRA